MQALALGRMYGDPTQLRDGSLGKYINSLRVPGTVAYVLSILKTWFDDMGKLELALAAGAPLPSPAALGRPGPGRISGVCPGAGRCFDRAELVELPGTGHLPYEECPETLTRLVNSFLVRMRGQGEAGPKLVPSSARLG